MTDLAASIRQHIADSVGVDVSEVSNDAKLRDLKWDGLDEMEFAFWLESQFGTRTDADEYVGLKTVGDLIGAAERAMENADA